MSDLAMIDSTYLAAYILAKVRDVKHLKLQKLLYYIQAWHLAFFEQPLIEDEFEAWVHGPVSMKVWMQYRDRSKLYATIPVNQQECDEAVKVVASVLAKEQIELIADVLEEYGDKTAYYLECLTHSEEPWRHARGDLSDGDRSARVISMQSMQDFYQSRVATS